VVDFQQANTIELHRTAHDDRSYVTGCSIRTSMQDCLQ